MLKSCLISAIAAGVACRAAVVDKRQFTVTVNDNGIIPASELPSPIVSSLPKQSPVSNAYDYDARELESLKAQAFLDYKSVSLNVFFSISVQSGQSWNKIFRSKLRQTRRCKMLPIFMYPTRQRCLIA